MFASSGLSSCLAAGSKRQTLDFLSAKIASTPLFWTCAWEIPLNSPEDRSDSGTEERIKVQPASCDSCAMVLYSRADQGPSSGSKCSTTNESCELAMKCSPAVDTNKTAKASWSNYLSPTHCDSSAEIGLHVPPMSPLPRTSLSIEGKACGRSKDAKACRMLRPCFPEQPPP